MPNGWIKTSDEVPILDRVRIFTEGLMTGIIPFIESNYDVYTDAAHRAIMGLSFGGLEILEAVTYHVDAFEYVGVLSSGWWISDTRAEKRGITDDIERRAAQLQKTVTALNESVKLLHFTQGGPEDLAYDNGIATLKLFDVAGINYQYSEMLGGHTWMVRRKNLRDLAPLLFR